MRCESLSYDGASTQQTKLTWRIAELPWGREVVLALVDRAVTYVVADGHCVAAAILRVGREFGWAPDVGPELFGGDGGCHRPGAGTAQKPRRS